MCVPVSFACRVMIASGWLSSGSVIVNYNTTPRASLFFDFLCPLVAGRLPVCDCTNAVLQVLSSDFRTVRNY